MLVRKGQEREYRPPLEPLIGDMAVRALACEVGHHRGLPVRLGGYFYFCKLSYSRLRAVRRDHETARKLSPTINRDSHALLLDGEGFAAADYRLEALPERVLQLAVLHDVGERRHAGAIGGELGARITVAVHPHRVHRRKAVQREPEESHVGGAERVDTGVEALLA